jgi:chromosome segregation protein
VDAPLDDANIEKVLSKLLLQFSQKTQFIVISHNKRTMALGDAIYGVTMEEHGISKVVSVSLREVTS